jgi:hypothetical protein
MRRRSLVLPFSLAAGFAACSDATSAPRVSIVTDLAVPRALLDKVTKLTVTVLEGEATCDPATGSVTKGAGAKELVANKALASTGCAGGARFCGDLDIDRSDATRVFAATGTDASGATLATGCASAVASGATLAVSIKMVRYLAPAVCGDGTVQPTEQCEPGGTPLCDATCQTNEVLLSTGSTQNKTTSGSPGDKTDPALLWPQGTGTAGWFYAFYTDRATGTSNNSDVGMRVMDADLAPLRPRRWPSRRRRSSCRTARTTTSCRRARRPSTRRSRARPRWAASSGSSSRTRTRPARTVSTCTSAPWTPAASPIRA